MRQGTSCRNGWSWPEPLPVSSPNSERHKTKGREACRERRVKLERLPDRKIILPRIFRHTILARCFDKDDIFAVGSEIIIEADSSFFGKIFFGGEEIDRVRFQIVAPILLAGVAQHADFNQHVAQLALLGVQNQHARAGVGQMPAKGLVRPLLLEGGESHSVRPDAHDAIARVVAAGEGAAGAYGQEKCEKKFFHWGSRRSWRSCLAISYNSSAV